MKALITIFLLSLAIAASSQNSPPKEITAADHIQMAGKRMGTGFLMMTGGSMLIAATSTSSSLQKQGVVIGAGISIIGMGVFLSGATQLRIAGDKMKSGKKTAMIIQPSDNGLSLVYIF